MNVVPEMAVLCAIERIVASDDSVQLHGRPNWFLSYTPTSSAWNSLREYAHRMCAHSRQALRC